MHIDLSQQIDEAVQKFMPQVDTKIDHVVEARITKVQETIQEELREIKVILNGTEESMTK